MSRKRIAITAAVSLSLAGALLLAGLAVAILAAPGPSGYHILKTITVGGTEGWDYVTMDSAARLLYVGRGNHVDVVNVDSGTAVGKVSGLSGTSGLLPVPELGRGFAMNGEASAALIVDLKTLEKIGTVKTGKDPDSFAYEPVTKRVFIMNSASSCPTARARSMSTSRIRTRL